MDQRKFWRTLWISVLGLGLFIVGYYFYIDISSKDALTKAIHRLHAAGLAVDKEELHAKYSRVKNGDNAVASMAKVITLPRVGETNLGSSRIPVERLARSEKLIDKYVSLVNEVLNKPEADFSNFWTYRLEMEFKPDFWGHLLSEAVLGKARLEYSRGNRKAAIGLILKNFQLANLFLSDPNTDSLARARMIVSNSFRFLRTISEHKYSNDEIEIVRKIRKSLDMQGDFAFYFQQVPTHIQVGYERLDEDLSNRFYPDLWRLHFQYAVSTPGQMRLNKARLYEELCIFVDLAKSNKGSLSDLKNDILKLESKYYSNPRVDINSAVKGYFAVSYSSIVDVLMQLQSYRNILDVALGEKEELDVFSGAPLKKKRLANRVLVYSVGMNGADDGGDEKKDIGMLVFSTLR